jgi:uncharacterized protein involved in exopolysaccharide biosynthesis
MPRENEEALSEISLLTYLNIILKNRRLYFFMIGGAFIITLFLNFFSPSYYLVSSTFIPEVVPQLQRLERLSGVRSYETTYNLEREKERLLHLCKRIFETQEIFISLNKKKYLTDENSKVQPLSKIFNLQDENETKISKAICERLKKMFSIKLDEKPGSVTLFVKTTQPLLGIELANSFVKELDKTLQKLEQTRAKESRLFIEARVKEARQALIKAEEELYNFRKRNRLITTPELKLQEERLIRNVDLAQTLFIALKKEYEFARLEEIKGRRGIKVLEKASVVTRQAKKVFNKITILLGVLITLFFTTGVAFLKEFLKGLEKEGNKEYKELRRNIGLLKQDFLFFKRLSR